MNLHDAIVLENVSKKYQLFASQWQMVKNALGFKNCENSREHYALKDVNLRIKKGERIGLIGRNGAGKTTLLKLITGNYAPTSGTVVVNGKVQALMNTGLGFHPEFTGMENIRSSLLYNGLNKKEYHSAVEEIIDFVELGDFLEQPLKTYSLGMQSRLYFAVATAIHPEILIIDEVLGAGDAYFSAKCADRMKKLTKNGCTLILVSHSTQQVLQFCDQAYWLEAGQLVMQGQSIDIIRAYEEYIRKMKHEAAEKQASNSKNKPVSQSKWLQEKLLAEVLKLHGQKKDEPIIDSPQEDIVNRQGVSRWPSLESGLKIYDVRVLDKTGNIVNHVQVNELINIEITIIAEAAGCYDVYFVIVLFTEDGRWLVRHCSSKMQINLQESEGYTMYLQYDKVLLGDGKYLFSAGIYSILDLKDLSTARYYDLLSRSFEFNVYGNYINDTTIFHHPSRWLSAIETSIVTT